MRPCERDESRELCLFRRHAEFCLVFSNPLRLRLLFLLGTGERTVTDMADLVEAPLPTVSQHLRIMRDLGCVESRRDGRTVFYRASNPKFLQAAKLIREGIVELTAERARAVDIAPPAPRGSGNGASRQVTAGEHKSPTKKRNANTR